MPEEWVAEWQDAITPWVDGSAPVADVGAGTGIWSGFFAKWFDVDVVGVEPSSGMRQQAALNRSSARTLYVGGNAERLPLRGASCGTVWMSTVLHHFSDLARAAREARRILRNEGYLLIRQGFSGRHDEILWTRAFPTALAVAEERHIALDRVLDAFTGAGFEHLETRRVHEISAMDISEYVQKVSTRADSTLTLISEVEFQEGMARLKSIAEEWTGGPVRTGLDLVVLH